MSNDDIFQHAWESLNEAASDDLVATFMRRLDMLSQHSPHLTKGVGSCKAMFTKETLTLLHMLVASYVINGGILLKHPDEICNEENERPESDSEAEPEPEPENERPESDSEADAEPEPEPAEPAPTPDLTISVHQALTDIGADLDEDISWLDDELNGLSVASTTDITDGLSIASTTDIADGTQ